MNPSPRGALTLHYLTMAVLAIAACVWIVAPTARVIAQAPALLFLSGNTGGQPANAVTLAAFPVSTTTTARNVSGTLQFEKSSRWVVSHAPATSNKATITLAAEASVRHVVDCIGWSGDSTGAVTAAAGTVILYDGASGGTVLIPLAVAHAVAAGAGIQTIPPNAHCNLNLVGTTNTAMTIEFDAAVTNELQRVWMSGYNVQ